MAREPTFTDAPFMSAAQKIQAYRAWLRFLRGNLEKHLFTKALYDHLNQHCSFIAHHDLHGFYQVYFTTGDGRIRFLEQFTTGVSTEYGDRWWLKGEYADLNEAMCRTAREHAPRLQHASRTMQRQADLAAARRLAERHGGSVAFEDRSVLPISD